MRRLRDFRSSLGEGDVVEVYRNLHTGGLSIRLKGIVVGHTKPDEAILLTNVRTRVSEAGRSRVLREKRKNVHAFLIGEFHGTTSLERFSHLPRLTYDPYKYESFVDVDSELAIDRASSVAISGANGAHYNILSVDN